MHNHSHDNETDAALPEAGASVPASKADLGKMGARLAGKTGKPYWKSFDELAQTPEFEQWVEDEFPNRKTLLQVDRRKFLTLGGAALGLAGLSGCRFLPQQQAVPYVRSPEDLVVGKSLVYATALSRAGYGMGVLVESHEGRPNKIEGNPRHPASLGATDVWGQAELLTMYDPDRSQAVINQNEISSWDQFLGVVRQDLKARRKAGGAGLAILTETITSPTLAAQMAAFMAAYPQAKWHAYEPMGRDNVYAGTTQAFGRPLNPVYRLKNANVIVTLDADFLLTMPGSVRYASDYASGRRVRKNNSKMNRMYAIESSYTITGASADHRFPVKPSQIEAIAGALQAAVSGGATQTVAGISADAFGALVADLQANRGRAVVIPGDEATPAVHALAHAINSAIGAIGSTVVYSAPIEVTPTDKLASLRDLISDMNAGRVQTLVIMGGNPVYNAPADLQFAEALTRHEANKETVPLRIHFGMYSDETAKMCHWHIAESHALEAWSDVRAFDGTASIVQPLIAPLYDTRSASEFIAELADEPRFGYEIVRDYWEGQQTGGNFERWWEMTLHNGVVPNSAAPFVTPTLAASLPTVAGAGGEGLEVNFRLDPTIYDGRYANNSWLQELPKPITTITWDNAAIISPATAKKMGLIYNNSDNDAQNIGQTSGKRVVAVQVNGGSLRMPVWILPGQPADTITLHLGYGRTSAGAVGGTSLTDTQGFDVYRLRTADTMGYATGAKVTATNETYEISNTQPHHTMRGINEEENRKVVVAGTLAEYIKNNGKMSEDEHIPSFPEATGWGHSEEHENERGVTGVDGSLSGIRNDRGHYNNDTTPEVEADWYRKDWKYTEKSSSNKEGWPSLYPEFSNKDFNAWAMSIDLTTCIGCNACTIACQAENNIPTVGKEQIGKGREMHWIRIDHYYAGEDWENPESYFQPVACVHCEKAPCEPVCPVAATVHSHEGLNQMVYNRCIGTRYCSNNCPYKVRRFNFLKWTQGAGGPTTLNFVELPVLKMLPNPDVTVRGRGVMEKCTYCVQRISQVRIEAKKEQREIRDGEIITACQQVCPTQAIIFGDINNPNSQVSKLRSEPHDYSLLADLNTRPRTTYLARVTNPNPAIKSAGPGETVPKELAPAG